MSRSYKKAIIKDNGCGGKTYRRTTRRSINNSLSEQLQLNDLDEIALKDPKNVIEAAYFTMKGDALLGAAKNEGNTKAMQRLKNSLKSTGAGTNSKKITTSSSDSIWVTVARQLGKQ